MGLERSPEVETLVRTDLVEQAAVKLELDTERVTVRDLEAAQVLVLQRPEEALEALNRIWQYAYEGVGNRRSESVGDAVLLEV